MNRSMFRLFAAAVLTVSLHPTVNANPPTCEESSETCANTYGGCPFIYGFPPALTMVCYTDCSQSEYLYTEECSYD